MYSENRIKDVLFFLRALSSNQLARLFPSLYLRLNKETGRGNELKNPEQISDYFFGCFKDYLNHLGNNINYANDYLKGKHVLEYGPGNILGIALLFYAYGAQQVHCVDRFPFEVFSKENLKVYHMIINSLKENERIRACSAFKKYGEPQSGFDPKKIKYFVTKNGLIGENNRYDLIISRAVLEHVSDLDKTFYDFSKALKKGGVSIHQVDLRSHNLDRYKDFDFLTLSPFVYRLMYSHKGFPNRWRIDQYKELADKFSLKYPKFESTGKLDPEKIKIIHSKLAKPFRALNQDDISWLGFWMIIEHDHFAKISKNGK